VYNTNQYKATMITKLLINHLLLLVQNATCESIMHSYWHQFFICMGEPGRNGSTVSDLVITYV